MHCRCVVFEIFFCDFFNIFISDFFPGRFATSGSMIRLSVPEIEGGSPERDGGEGEGEGEGEGLVLEYSSSWIICENGKSGIFLVCCSRILLRGATLLHDL